VILGWRISDWTWCSIGLCEAWFLGLSTAQHVALDLVGSLVLVCSTLASTGILLTNDSLTPGAAALHIASALTAGEYLSSCPQVLLFLFIVDTLFDV
jgi:hypothetical protein